MYDIVPSTFFPPENWISFDRTSRLHGSSQSQSPPPTDKLQRETNSYTDFINAEEWGLDVVTIIHDWFNLKIGWIVSMSIPLVPCRFDIKT